MAHSIEIWRAVLSTTETLLALAEPPAEAELTAPDETPVIEVSRKYPGLSRAIAEYLAR